LASIIPSSSVLEYEKWVDVIIARLDQTVHEGSYTAALLQEKMGLSSPLFFLEWEEIIAYFD